MDPTIDAWAVSSLRYGLGKGYYVVASIIAAHWLVTAVLAKRPFLRIKSANVALALSGLTFAFDMVIASMVAEPASLFKGACPVLDLPDTLPPPLTGTFAFDAQSPCEAFAETAAPIVLLGVPLILLAASALLRIVESRRT